MRRPSVVVRRRALTSRKRLSVRVSLGLFVRDAPLGETLHPSRWGGDRATPDLKIICLGVVLGGSDGRRVDVELAGIRRRFAELLGLMVKGDGDGMLAGLDFDRLRRIQNSKIALL